MRDRDLANKMTLSGLGYAETDKCANSRIPTIEERLQYMEEQAKYSIECAKTELAKVERIKAALKKNPALSDLYSLLRF